MLEDSLITLERGFLKDLDYPDIKDRLILRDSDTLFKIADVWANNRGAIMTVIKVRYMIALEHLTKTATPAEVLVLREAMNILDLLIEDMNSYWQERLKRTPEEQKKELLQSLPDST